MNAPRPTRLTYAWRAACIAVVVVGILVFGFSQGRAILDPTPDLPSPPELRQAEPAIEPLPGSKLARSHPVVYNGGESVFAQYRSTHTAVEVVAQFEELHGAPVADAKPTEGTMVRVVTPAYAMAGGIDSDGERIGIMAFNDPKAGGSTYFVGKGGEPGEGWRQGDVPGNEVAGIPRPLRSRRVLCVDGLGGITSRLLIYQGFGEIDDIVAAFVTEMPKANWKRNAHVEEIIQKRLPGRFLSFLNGTKRAMIYIERDTQTGKVRTAVVYTVKGWLPPERGV